MAPGEGEIQGSPTDNFGERNLVWWSQYIISESGNLNYKLKITIFIYITKIISETIMVCSP